MTTTTLEALAPTDIEAARERNLSTWQASSRLLYAGRIEEFVQYWTEDASYESALPVPGIPAVITGRDALRAMFAAYGQFAQAELLTHLGF